MSETCLSGERFASSVLTFQPKVFGRENLAVGDRLLVRVREHGARLADLGRRRAGADRRDQRDGRRRERIQAARLFFFEGFVHRVARRPADRQPRLEDGEAVETFESCIAEGETICMVTRVRATRGTRTVRSISSTAASWKRTASRTAPAERNSKSGFDIAH